MAMNMDDEPSWLKNETASANKSDWDDPNTSTQKQVADTGTAFEEAKKSFHAAMNPGDDEFKTLAIRGFTFIHIAAATLMYTSAVVSFSRDPGFGEFFIAAYTSLFATILAGFELSKAYEMDELQSLFLDNFGFLYHPTYKGIYLIFIAFVNLGLSSNSPTLEYFTTSFVLFDGIALIYFRFQKPEWFPIEDGPVISHKPVPNDEMVI